MGATFQNYHLQPFLLEALQDLGFKRPTPIQMKVIPTIQRGQSVVGKSATGSGKTHAFLLPLVNAIEPANKQPQVIITTPSRELAYQIYHNLQELVGHSPNPIGIANYVGGTDKERQIEKLQRDQPQIVVGTPGRLLDLARGQHLALNLATRLVIDEADMTLDLGFLGDVDQLAARMPANLQMMVFSATIPPKLQPFLRKYMKNPVIDDIPTETVINHDVSNGLLSDKGQDRNQLLYQLLTIGQPYLALIFANTRERVDQLQGFLQEQGLRVAKVHGGMEPRVRKRVMKQIQALDYQFVVATDLAARGIDIPGVSLVINDELPSDLEYFIHRVGRTGRNGMSGTAITIYGPDDDSQITALEKMGIKFTPKQLKNGQLVDYYERDRRANYRGHHDQLAGATLGMIKKKQKKVKPGYKKKIKQAIKRTDEQQHKIAVRNQIRAQKKQKKRNSERYQ